MENVESMARAFRHTFGKRLPDGRRITRACSKWYIEYRDATGKLRRLPGFSDRRATEAHANELQRRVDRQAAGILDAESLNLTAQLVAPIQEHVGAYETNLRAGGVSAQHLSETCRRLKRLFVDCGFERPVDLRSEPAQK